MKVQDRLKEFKACFKDSPIALLIVKILRDSQNKPCDFRIFYVNEALCKTTGVAADVLVSANFSKVFDNAESKWAEFYAGVSESGEIDTICDFSPEINRYISLQAYKLSDDYCVGIMTDVTEQKLVEQKYLDRAKEADFLNILLKNTSGGIYMTDMSHYTKVDYANDKYYELYGYTKQQYETELDSDISVRVFPEDMQKIKDLLKEYQNGTADNLVMEYRATKRNGEVAYYRNSVSISEAPNANTMVGILIDVTEEKIAHQIIERQNKEITQIYNAIPGGIFSCKYDEYWTVISANNGFFSFLGYTREEFERLFQSRMLGVIHEDDKMPMYEIVSSQLEHTTGIKNTNRLVCAGGVIKWISIHAELMENEQGEQFFYCVFVDITEQKFIEQALIESEVKKEIALKSSKLVIWTYDLNTKKIFTDTRASQGVGWFDTAYDGYKEIINKGLVMPDCISEYIRIHKELEQGALSTTAIIHFNKEKMKLEWQRITYTNIFDKSGKPTIAIASGEDVTEFVNMQNRYKSELIYHEKMNDTELLAKAKLNITQNTVDTYSAKPNASCMKSDKFDDLVLNVQQTATTQQEKDRLAIIFDRENVLEEFSKGNTEFKAEFLRRLNDGTKIWSLTTLKCFLDIETSDVLGFWYSTDINENKMSHIIIDKISAMEYELLALLNVKDDTITIHHSKHINKHPNLENKSIYSKQLKDMYKDCTIQEGKEECIKALSIKTAVQELQTKDEYSCAFTILKENGEMLRKKWLFCYLDQNKETLLVSRSDITDFYKKELEQVSKLKKALESAEQASVAKSGFLSRMSHEIRTPMSAILGMTAIAQQEIEKQYDIKNYLDKVEISAKFLLTLINDILDMSRIESGKMVIKQDKIYFEDFILDINTICQEQARNKGVMYQSIICKNINKVYIGDSTKLQQVLINIISNAIKFTPEGGKVQFSVLQEKVCDTTKAKLKFTVSDTGIGINEKDIEKIFVTFEQVHTSATSTYGGTGLGLAISKNIVELMGGVINVTSIEGVGSEFTVELELETDPETEGDVYEHKITQNLNYDFTGKKALLVEDHKLNIEIEKKLLENKNMQVETAQNGLESTIMFENNGAGYYDIIIMDINMPVMDGLTAAKVIRQSNNIDAKTIPIIAMSANAFDEDKAQSKQSGMNDHIAKPVDPSFLFETIKNLLDK